MAPFVPVPKPVSHCLHHLSRPWRKEKRDHVRQGPQEIHPGTENSERALRWEPAWCLLLRERKQKPAVWTCPALPGGAELPPSAPPLGSSVLPPAALGEASPGCLISYHYRENSGSAVGTVIPRRAGNRGHTEQPNGDRDECHT